MFSFTTKFLGQMRMLQALYKHHLLHRDFKFVIVEKSHSPHSV